MSVEPDVLEFFVDFNPPRNSEEGVLRVNAQWERREERMDPWSGRAMYIFSFRKFTDSMWMALGKAAKHLAHWLRL